MIKSVLTYATKQRRLKEKLRAHCRPQVSSHIQIKRFDDILKDRCQTLSLFAISNKSKTFSDC